MKPTTSFFIVAKLILRVFYVRSNYNGVIFKFPKISVFSFSSPCAKQSACIGAVKLCLPSSCQKWVTCASNIQLPSLLIWQMSHVTKTNMEDVPLRTWNRNFCSLYLNLLFHKCYLNMDRFTSEWKKTLNQKHRTKYENQLTDWWSIMS